MIAARLARLLPVAAKRQMNLSRAFCSKRDKQESDEEEQIGNRDLEKEFKDEILNKDTFMK